VHTASFSFSSICLLVVRPDLSSLLFAPGAVLFLSSLRVFLLSLLAVPLERREGGELEQQQEHETDIKAALTGLFLLPFRSVAPFFPLSLLLKIKEINSTLTNQTNRVDGEVLCIVSCGERM
jgi:hypothetical protein